MHSRDSRTVRFAGAARLLGGPTAAALGVFALALGIVALLFWSTNSVDELSRERQHRLVANLLVQSAQQTAHDQESVTVWDDSIRQLRKAEIDLEWLDLNLGI